ncbi:hypothetical protein P7K49_009829 [Saguinus oedipus]|uniref:E3 ubiquitin-protein ligase makorin 1 C-terminal domain-containing protein n=1 Tax=Saguinus oedipus TaxID=9490 RepID=A0ABQ9VL34_SAGOE|nr:hypothetical protein P7K49_009829 [Saguinus oedipus]
MNTGEAESNSNFATVGAGSEDWLDAVEFVLGQLYCSCTAPFCSDQRKIRERTNSCDKEAALPLGCSGRGGMSTGWEKEEKQKHIRKDKEAMSSQKGYTETGKQILGPVKERLLEEREYNDPSDNNKEELVTSELGEMLLMLLAADEDDKLTDFENEWDLFHDDLEDFYDLTQ